MSSFFGRKPTPAAAGHNTNSMWQSSDSNSSMSTGSSLYNSGGSNSYTKRDPIPNPNYVPRVGENNLYYTIDPVPPTYGPRVGENNLYNTNDSIPNPNYVPPSGGPLRYSANFRPVLRPELVGVGYPSAGLHASYEAAYQNVPITGSTRDLPNVLQHKPHQPWSGH